MPEPDEQEIQPEEQLEEKPAEQAGVTVDLEAEEAEQKPKAVKPDPKLSALEKRAWGTQRVVERLERVVLDMQHQLSQQSRPQQPQRAEMPTTGREALPATASQEAVDQYNRLAEEGRWQDAVRLLAREEAKALLLQQQQSQLIQEQEQARTTRLEAAKQRVWDRYPMLHELSGDNTTTEAQLYAQVVAADPGLLNSPDGPETAMYRMERIAAEQGIKLNALKPNAPVPDSRRVGGGRAPGSLPPSRGTGAARSGEVILTPEQKQFCDYHGIKYTDYARQLRTEQSTGEVTV